MICYTTYKPKGLGNMKNSKLDRAVGLLVSECLASFEYSLGWDCAMFDESLRVAITDALANYEHRGEFIEIVLGELGEYETTG